LHLPQQDVVPNGIEVALNVGVDDHRLMAVGDGGADLLASVAKSVGDLWFRQFSKCVI
jgi:hypothetical protein